MPPQLSPSQIGLVTAEGVILIAGLWVWWWTQLSRSGVRFRQQRLADWPISPWSFAVAALQVIAGGLVGVVLARSVMPYLPAAVSADVAFSTVLINAGLHLGVIAGVLLARSSLRRVDRLTDEPPPPLAPATPLTLREAIVAGLLTFCATVVLLVPVGLAWGALLKQLGLPVERQELIDV